MYGYTLDRTYSESLLKLSSGHNLTKLFHCVVFKTWKNIEFVLKLVVALTYRLDCKLIIYSLLIE